MTVLVLGGAGYVGSHAVDMLVNRGYDVAVVDNLVTGHREAVSEKVRFYEGDVRDHAFLASVFEKENTFIPDEVFKSIEKNKIAIKGCLLYTSPSPRDTR